MSGKIGLRTQKEKYWQEQLENWCNSGLSQAEFSRQVGISKRSLGYWKRKFENKQNPVKGQAVVAVSLPYEGSTEQDFQPIIIHAWHGLRIEIPVDFSPESLEKIIHVLGGLS